MKAVTLPEIVSRIRCRRSGKTFLAEFINQCKIEDAIIIPEGATNGDMIKAMLLQNNSVYELEITEIETAYCEKVIKVIGRSKEKDPNIIGGKNKPLFNCTFKAEWWNSPFKKEVEE